MDQIANPYFPGAGTPPHELVGRDPILQLANVLLGRTLARKPDKSLLLTGLRGVGKTVLLNEIERRARTKGFKTILIEAHEEKALGPLLAPHLRTLLFELNRLAGISDKVKRGISVLRSFIGTLKITYSDITIGIDPEIGSADSGDIEVDLPQLFVAIGEAAADRNQFVAIFIDELQYLTSRELGALVMAMHTMQQRQLPIVLLGAGLPVLPGFAGDSKSYAERLFSFPDVGALSEADAGKALQEPAQAQNVDFEARALKEIYRLTKGYPYFVQEWGYLVWNQAQSSPIKIEDVRKATPEVINRLDENFFRVRFGRLTPGEKNFLRAMAQLGDGQHKMGDIASLLKVTVSTLSPIRSHLIKKGMIYSPRYGSIAFTVPLFDQFMVRAIPNFDNLSSE
jgi:hypothetical protein